MLKLKGGRMLKIKLLTLITILSMVFWPNMGLAKGEAEFANGKVVKSSAKNLTIQTYDYTEKKDIKKDFLFNSKSDITNIDIESLDEIKSGQEVNIYYKPRSGKNIIESIYVFK